jgi:hypothetical protein
MESGTAGASSTAHACWAGRGSEQSKKRGRGGEGATRRSGTRPAWLEGRGAWCVLFRLARSACWAADVETVGSHDAREHREVDVRVHLDAVDHEQHVCDHEKSVQGLMVVRQAWDGARAAGAMAMAAYNRELEPRPWAAGGGGASTGPPVAQSGSAGSDLHAERRGADSHKAETCGIAREGAHTL